MSWQIRQAVSSDVEFLMDIDPLAKTEKGRQEHIQRSDAAMTQTTRLSRQWPSRES